MKHVSQELYSKLNKKIQHFAGIYAHSIGVSIEDLVQEIWVFILENDLMDFPSSYIGKSIENYCCRAYYNSKKRFGAKDSVVCSLCFSDFDESYVAASDQDLATVSISKFDTFSDITLNSLLSELDVKSYTYVVVKAYLSGNFPELAAKYEHIISEVHLSQDQINELISLKANDNFIAKYILGYSSSTSGSFRNIRKNLKETCQKLCIY